MGAIKDITTEINEPNSARMKFRTKEHVKRTIQRAAALSGLDNSAFTSHADINPPCNGRCEGTTILLRRSSGVFRRARKSASARG